MTCQQHRIFKNFRADHFPTAFCFSLLPIAAYFQRIYSLGGNVTQARFWNYSTCKIIGTTIWFALHECTKLFSIRLSFCNFHDVLTESKISYYKIMRNFHKTHAKANVPFSEQIWTEFCTNFTFSYSYDGISNS